MLATSLATLSAAAAPSKMATAEKVKYGEHTKWLESVVGIGLAAP